MFIQWKKDEGGMRDKLEKIEDRFGKNSRQNQTKTKTKHVLLERSKEINN